MKNKERGSGEQKYNELEEKYRELLKAFAETKKRVLDHTEQLELAVASAREILHAGQGRRSGQADS